MTISDGIQILIAIVAVGASVIALIVANKDRKTQMRIARQNREHSRLLLELEYAIKLSANRNRGGSTDKLEREQMGAEALALAAVVGENWVPRQWEDATGGMTLDEMRTILRVGPTQEHPEWVLRKIESMLAVRAILDRLYGDNEQQQR